MRHAHLLAPLGLAALLATSPPLHARADDGQAADPAVPLASALDPGAPQLPLRHSPLPPSGAIAQEWTDWREANAAVAEFPRGHMDILRWEAEQAGQAGQAAAPHSGHATHGSKP